MNECMIVSGCYLTPCGKCDVTKSTEAVNTGLNMHKYAKLR